MARVKKVHIGVGIGFGVLCRARGYPRTNGHPNCKTCLRLSERQLRERKRRARMSLENIWKAAQQDVRKYKKLSKRQRAKVELPMVWPHGGKVEVLARRRGF